MIRNTIVIKKTFSPDDAGLSEYSAMALLLAGDLMEGDVDKLENAIASSEKDSIWRITIEQIDTP